MKNYVQPGKTLSYLNESGDTIPSGQMVVVAGLGAGIAAADIVDDGVGELSFEGVHSYAKAVGAIAQGDGLYLHIVNNNLENTPGAGKVFVGVAAEAALNADAEVQVKLGLSRSLSVAANQAANATAAAVDDATVWALANALKADLNALLVKLKAAGLMVADA